jgi:hypothetical protein
VPSKTKLLNKTLTDKTAEMKIWRARKSDWKEFHFYGRQPIIIGSKSSNAFIDDSVLNLFSALASLFRSNIRPNFSLQQQGGEKND